MLEGLDLQSALKDIHLHLFTGITYRLIRAKFMQTALSGAGSISGGGRYNPANSFEALYLADHPITALQEVQAVFRVGSQLIATHGPARILLTVECSLQSVLNLTKPEVQRLLGTNIQELTGHWLLKADDGPTPTQKLGSTCYEQGNIEALKVPSARDPRAFNLVVLPTRLQPGSSVHVHDEDGVVDAKLP